MSESGLLVLDKPPGITSHGVVTRVRRLLGTRRVGHAGTLDPMATGVLVIGIGRGTRLLGHLTAHDKEYTATIRLGSSTVTDDREGEPLSHADPSRLAAVTDEQIRAEVARLTGPISQVPTAVSAVKVDGRRAHARVRAGEDVQLAAREVVVERFDVTAIRRSSGTIDVDVHVACSAGTYVRALARDLGSGLGVGGHLTQLQRVRSGPWTIADAVAWDALDAADDPSGYVIDLGRAVHRAFPVITVDAPARDWLVNGRPPAQVIHDEVVDVTAVVGPDEDLVALIGPGDRGPAYRAVFQP